jgi:tRNA nucleotidyltransferase (CCA-adding enzyme)
LNEKETADIRKAIPRRDLAEAWRDLEDNAKELAKRLTGKEAATPSRTWKLLSSARQEMVLYLAITARQQAVQQKIKNFFTKWRQVQQKIPLPEMTELLITPQLPEYPKIADEVFMLLLDGKLRSRNEILKFLKPLAPPPPPPPPPPRRGRGAKAAAVAAQTPAPSAPVAGKKKGKGAAAAAPAPTPVPAAQSKPAAKPASKPAPPAKPAKPAKAAPKPAAKKTAPKKSKKKR